MARTPDKPGKYRIKQKGLDWVVSGVKLDGRRVRLAFDNESQARTTASQLFGDVVSSTVNQKVDEWGIPVSVNFPEMGTDTANAVAAAMGIPAAGEKTPEPKNDKKAEENRKRAQSLCEIIGVGWAAGDVFLARKLTTTLNKEPVNPSPKQVNSLADTAQTAFSDLFGDRQVGPWTMLFLMTLALPMSMMLQSPPKKKTEDNSSSDSQGSNLRAV